ncbi:hypothetical protein ASPFODRAFT_697261 [Aspergillus luchuensis CBS 106.47]|uniref:Uncharacterized protein n=1 Tax=Aspergillus luchuensis (strain CBS 106.47) TaxID=1137211 RepID=A0A1M3U166_ASPLC|nr:hypothetical protein ASPFODRAFT_697261 [Aspergillus luchuensis CBS 106.47]
MAPNALSLESLSDGRSMGRHNGVLRTSLLEYSAFSTWLVRTRQYPSYGTVDSVRLAPPRRGGKFKTQNARFNLLARVSPAHLVPLK